MAKPSSSLISPCSSRMWMAPSTWPSFSQASPKIDGAQSSTDTTLLSKTKIKWLAIDLISADQFYKRQVTPSFERTKMKQLTRSRLLVTRWRVACNCGLMKWLIRWCYPDKTQLERPMWTSGYRTLVALLIALIDRCSEWNQRQATRRDCVKKKWNWMMKCSQQAKNNCRCKSALLLVDPARRRRMRKRGDDLDVDSWSD